MHGIMEHYQAAGWQYLHSHFLERMESKFCGETMQIALSMYGYYLRVDTVPPTYQGLVKQWHN